MKERKERAKLVPGKISRELRRLVQHTTSEIGRRGTLTVDGDLSEETEGRSEKRTRKSEGERMDVSSWISGDTHDSIKSIESCRTRLDFTFSTVIHGQRYT